MKMFCIPYAGGMSNAYCRWKDKVDGTQIIPIELKGRGKRYEEGYYNDMDEAVRDVENLIKEKLLNNEKFAIFGHSMGAVMAYELYYKLENDNLRPEIIFFSARRPPHLMIKDSCLHNLPLDELKEELILMGGTPKSLFDYPELINVCIPIIRADFRVLYEYEYKVKKEKIKSKVVILYGKEDNISLSEISKWNELTQEECNIYGFDDGHFFINKCEKSVIKCLLKELEEVK